MLLRSFLIALLIALPSPVFAAKRVALVIGNAAYSNAAALANPVNDATDIAAALKNVGFSVIEAHDLTRANFEATLHTFSVEMQGAETAVFFYSGHGLQVHGINYLVPTDAVLTSADSIDFEMVPLKPPVTNRGFLT